MARFSSLSASRPKVKRVENTRVFSVLGEFCANRFEELNTYSDLLTSQIRTILRWICRAQTRCREQSLCPRPRDRLRSDGCRPLCAVPAWPAKQLTSRELLWRGSLQHPFRGGEDN